ncbi:MAG: CheR family methyltransferase [Myxococcales bacterium]
MTAARRAYARGAEVLEDLLGFRPEPTRADDVEEAVRERIARRQLGSLDAYAELLVDPQQRLIEARALADLATVNETYFYREPEHQAILRALAVMPGRTASERQPLRVLSLGCSTGEEPYTVALVLSEAGLDHEAARIHAVDASPSVVARAERGVYSAWSLRNLPEHLRDRHFTHRGGQFTLSEKIRRYVRFEARNALEDDNRFWDRPSFDVVFCRNLLIYLTPRAARTVIERCAQVLHAGGYLFLAHSETGHAGRHFSVQSAHGAFYFVRKSDAAPLGSASAPAARAPTRPAPTGEALVAQPSQASPVSAVAPQHERPSLARTPRSTGLPGELWHLWREERFTELRAKLRLIPSPGTELMPLMASLSMQEGKLTEAHECCVAMLAFEPAWASAHHLLGLMSEQRGETREACRHHLRAVALDPDFALPSLRAGILARRLGDRPLARRLLREAIRLLPFQTAEHLVLFAGGFSAEALVALARAELQACGGEP